MREGVRDPRGLPVAALDCSDRAGNSDLGLGSPPVPDEPQPVKCPLSVVGAGRVESRLSSPGTHLA